MSDNIEHPGIVKSIENQKILVEIQPQSACGSCHSKSVCGLADSSGKIVEITGTPQIDTYTPGQMVVVTLQRSLGYRALLLGYLLPFLLLLITLFAGVSITANEAASAALSLGIVVVYFTILYFFRERVKQSFHFSIKQ